MSVGTRIKKNCLNLNLNFIIDLTWHCRITLIKYCACAKIFTRFFYNLLRMLIRNRVIYYEFFILHSITFDNFIDFYYMSLKLAHIFAFFLLFAKLLLSTWGNHVAIFLSLFSSLIPLLSNLRYQYSRA